MKTRKNMLSGPLDQLNYEIDHGPIPLEWDRVPPDLYERKVQEYRVVGDRYTPAPGGTVGIPETSNDLVRKILNDTNVLASTVALDRGLIGRIVLVTSTPTLILNAQYLRGYLLLNPAAAVGLTSAGTLLSTTFLSNGLSPFSTVSLGVGNYKTLRLTLNVTGFSGAGTVIFDAQTLDPADGSTWITTQTLFSVTANGTFYANLGDFGVDTDFRILISIPVGVTLNARIGFVLKDGLEGTSTGVAQTIFIGPSGVTSDVGYPLLSGREKAFYLRENTVLYAVTSGPTLPLRIFEL